MVSFVCDQCQDTIKKPKLEAHAARCRASFTCIDCNVTFYGREWQGHTQCISEEQKYQKGTTNGKGRGGQGGKKAPQPQQAISTPAAEPTLASKQPNAPEATATDNGKVEEPLKKPKKEKKRKDAVESAEIDAEKGNKRKGGKEKKGKKDEKEEDKKDKKEKKTKKARKLDDVPVQSEHSVSETRGNGASEDTSRRKKKAKMNGKNAESSEKSSDKKQKRKASEMEDDELKPRKKKNKGETNGEPALHPSDDDAPMPDITTLLLPGFTDHPPAEPNFSAHQADIHHSRIRNFNNTDTFADVDPSFKPRPQDIKKARQAYDPDFRKAPEPQKPKLTLQEKQKRRKAKREARKALPPPFVPPVIVAVSDPIDDAVQHFLGGLTEEGQKLNVLVRKLKDDVKAGGRLIKIAKELWRRLGVSREAPGEEGKEGRIVIDVVKPLKLKKKGENAEGRDAEGAEAVVSVEPEEDDSDSDSDSGSDSGPSEADEGEIPLEDPTQEIETN